MKATYLSLPCSKNERKALKLHTFMGVKGRIDPLLGIVLHVGV